MRRICVLFLLILSVCVGADAQHGVDPLDEAIGRLCVMSQQDEAFEGIGYDGGYLTARGCLPVSVANGVIALWGIEDRQTAIDLVCETAEVLAGDRTGKKRADLTRMQALFGADARAAEAERAENLAHVICGSDMQITVLESKLNAQCVMEYTDGVGMLSMLVGRRDVQPDWTPMMEIVHALHEMGMDDALLCLAGVSGGRKDGGPLGSGKDGHYLTLMLQVGTFMDEGRMYVLDSLPRALEGEKSGYTLTMHTHYPFALKRTAFSEIFDVTRISDTVIRLTMRATDAWKDMSPAAHADALRPLLLYGSGALMIRMPGQRKTAQ